MSRKNIEGIDGGFIQYDSQDEDEADALNADTFGDDALDGFEPSSQGFFDSMRPDGNRLNPPPGLGRPVQSGSRQRQERPTPPPGLTRPSPPPEVLRRPSPPTIGLYLVEHISPPPPPPPPGPEAPPLLSSVSVPPPPPPPPEASNALTGRPSVPQMSIHVVPVRVFPTPFTARQKAQALAGQLDVNKWGRQEEFVRDHELMTFRDREFVTKIQLNQMVALSGSQNHRGQFTFARSSGAPAAISQSQKDKSSSLGKRLYASVYHPRKLVSFENMTSGSDESVKSDKSRQIAEDVFDLLIDVSEIDEYISTLHPLAEDKINEAILERTEILERATNTLVGYTGSKQGKLGVAQKNVIDKLVELLQPAVTDNEAQARRSLIFRRVPEAVQGFYIDLLEKIVQQ